MKLARHWPSAVVAAAVLSGCGGGGGDSSGIAIRHEISPGSALVTAGETLSVSAIVKSKGGAPSSMSWSIVPIEGNSSAGGTPQISNDNCASKTTTPPAREGFYAEGRCEALILFPAEMRSGSWELVSNASTPTGSSAKKIRIDVQSSSNNFVLLTPAGVANGFTNRAVTLNAPIQTEIGKTYTEISYKWQADTNNPSNPALLNADTPQMVFYPTAPGQYIFTVKVSGRVNGNPAERTRTVVVNVEDAPIPELIQTNDLTSIQPGSPFTLRANISNTNQGYQYTYRWQQVDNTGVTIPLNNAQTLQASGIAPLVRQVYAFDFILTRISPSGVTSETRQRVHLMVGGTSMVPQITINGGIVNQPVVLRADMPAGSNVITEYTWTQVGGPQTVTLSSNSDFEVMFIPAITGVYSFELKAKSRDASGTTVESTQTIQVNVTNPPQN